MSTNPTQPAGSSSGSGGAVGVILSILNIGQLVLTLEPLAVDAAMKLKALLELNPNIQVNVTNLSGDAITADDATIAAVQTWQKQNNLPTTPAAPAAPAAPTS